jgi:hypothetical protein
MSDPIDSKSENASNTFENVHSNGIQTNLLSVEKTVEGQVSLESLSSSTQRASRSYQFEEISSAN